MKRAAIINMSLNALRETSKPKETATADRPLENNAKHSQSKEDVYMQDLLIFIKSVAEARAKARKGEIRTVREARKGQEKQECDEKLAIPMAVCETVQLLLRKYLLFRTEERADGSRSKPKLTHDRSSHLKAFLRNNKENEGQQHEQPEDPFRLMASQKAQRDRLLARNQELQSEMVELRERLKEKNSTICKLLGKQAQLRRKYNEDLNRLLRNHNIYNISANFEREEEQGEGRNALNIAGRHIADSTSPSLREEAGSAYLKSQHKTSSKTLLKSDSEYIKEARPRLSRAKPKIYPFRPSRQAPATQFLKTANKSLPTECISRREQPLQLEESPAFELYVDQLEGTPLSKLAQEARKPVRLMREEEFEALQQKGFYNEDSAREMAGELKI